MFKKRQLTAIVCLGLLVACQEKLPMGPTDLATGIIIYENADFLGASAHITSDISHLKDFRGPCFYTIEGGAVVNAWDDCVSSVRVAPGWRAILFRDGDFDGEQLPINADTSNLQGVVGRCEKGGFNDCVTSIRLLRP